MVKAVPFFNFTNEKFSWWWDSVPYEFEPMTTFMMEDWKAEHFAKHLVNLELNRLGKSVADQSRPDLMKRALPGSAGAVESPASKIETELMNSEGPKPKVGKKSEGKFEGVA